MQKKYKLTKETKEFLGTTLYRIEALIDFSDVKKGDKGGFIEKEDNLAQEGDAWVYDNAWVYGNARVSGNARVYGNAWVYGKLKLAGGYFYHTKQKTEKVEIIENDENYETLCSNPKLEKEEITPNKKVKIRLSDNQIVEGEIIE